MADREPSSAARIRHPRFMEDAAMQLALAAEEVDTHIMDNGLAWRRQRLRDEIGNVKAMVEKHRAERRVDAEPSAAANRRYVRSNMGLVHALAPSGQRAVCGAALRESWEPAEVALWSSEPNICHSCDDVLMSRGRRSAS